MEENKGLNSENVTVEGVVATEKKKKKQSELQIDTIIETPKLELPKDFWEYKQKVDELINVVERLKKHTHTGNGAEPTL